MRTALTLFPLLVPWLVRHCLGPEVQSLQDHLGQLGSMYIVGNTSAWCMPPCIVQENLPHMLRGPGRCDEHRHLNMPPQYLHSCKPWPEGPAGIPCIDEIAHTLHCAWSLCLFGNQALAQISTQSKLLFMWRFGTAGVWADCQL